MRPRARKGSFSKSGQASESLNNLMLRYAQDHQWSNVAGCLLKGGDVDWRDGALLQIAMYFGSVRLLKTVLVHEPRVNLKKALELAEKPGNEKCLEIFNEYLNSIGWAP